MNRCEFLGLRVLANVACGEVAIDSLPSRISQHPPRRSKIQHFDSVGMRVVRSGLRVIFTNQRCLADRRKIPVIWEVGPANRDKQINKDSLVQFGESP